MLYEGFTIWSLHTKENVPQVFGPIAFFFMHDKMRLNFKISRDISNFLNSSNFTGGEIF